MHLMYYLDADGKRVYTLEVKNLLCAAFLHYTIVIENLTDG
jgi:hypothetical protein